MSIFEFVAKKLCRDLQTQKGVPPDFSQELIQKAFNGIHTPANAVVVNEDIWTLVSRI
jgi:hypothetical protein